MNELRIRSKIKDLTVRFVDNFNFIRDFVKLPHYVVIVGSIVYRHYKKPLFDQFPQERLIILPLNEKRKTLFTVMGLYTKLLSHTAKKNLTIISFGGGINQDVVGFVASTLYRGVNWIFVPTTLLAMADSAVGLKTSLNFASHKNVIGTFYPPTEVYVNVDFLKTLTKKDYVSGVGEIIKFYLMKKEALSQIRRTIQTIKKLKESKNQQLILKVVKESINIKLSYMEGDEFDQGRRNLLNYGHEFGHALESASSFDIPHGLAVIIGIIFANLVSFRKNWLDQKTFNYLNKNLLLPTITPKIILLKKKHFASKIIFLHMKKDKKRISEHLPLVLPDKHFNLVKITDFSVREFEDAMSQLMSILAPYLL